MATVFAAFSALKGYIKLKVTNESAVIDNIVFRLHYRATFVILLGASILVTSRQFFGDHIKCIINSERLPVAVINTFCFFTTTFTVPKYMNATEVALENLPHPGIGPVTDKDEIKHHAYYQWVPFVLFFQAICFYLPHRLWKVAEGGRMNMLIAGLRMTSLALQNTKMTLKCGKNVPTIEEKKNAIQEIRMAFLNRIHINRPWTYYLIFNEVLNMMNVMSQIYLTDMFLGGKFLELGFNQPEVPNMNSWDIVFPKVTKCTFHKYGPTGTIEKYDALCLMALNIINEKIYMFLWFWFILIAIVTGLGLVWRILTMLLHARSKRFNRLMFGMACPGKYNPWDVLKLTHEYYFGDWLFLYYIAKNLDNYSFKDLLEQLAHDMDSRRQASLVRRDSELEPLNAE